MKKLVYAIVLAPSLLIADERPDVLTRTLVDPVRVVATSETLAGADALCAPKFGQVSEGAFIVGSGPILQKGDWLILDFGRELHGMLQLGAGGQGARGAKARVRFGESVSETMSELIGSGGPADTNSWFTATNDHAIRDDVVELPWLGRREIGPSGFRFVRIDNVGDGAIQLEYARAVSLMRSMKRLGGFVCSDERLNAVWETAVRTVHLCCQDYLWDGIKRDRLVWMGDTHPETMSVLAVFGAAKVLPESLTYMARTTAPTAWMNGMPTYTLWWIRNLAEWYRFTGNRQYLKRNAKYLAATFDNVLNGMQGGQWLAGTFLDWPTEANVLGKTAGTQALALITARETAFLARELGDAALEEKANGLAAELEKLTALDPNGAKSAAALLALAGLREPKEMFDGVLGQKGNDDVSTFYGYYMLEAMSAAGEDQRALDTVRDYWGAMLDMGATSFWEDFNVSWTNNAYRIDEMPVEGKKDIHGEYGAYCYVGFRHSLCHGWSSGPAAWLIHHVLGIRPLDVGCKTVEVKPFLGDLEWAEGAMALPGKPGKDGAPCAVRVRASKNPDGTVEVEIDAPDSVKIVR